MSNDILSNNYLKYTIHFEAEKNNNNGLKKHCYCLEHYYNHCNYCFFSYTKSVSK